jgi:hypothetical protein
MPETTPDEAPDPLDPFGAAPPAPPSWMIENAAFTPLPQGRIATPVSPVVETPATSSIAPAVESPIAQPAPIIDDGPNLHSDDAPPALPAGLKGLFGSTGAGLPANVNLAPPAVVLQQPAGVRAASRPVAAPASDVVQVSAELPLSIPLINPAAAIAADPGEDGLQQAIYYEASDQPAN